MKIPAFFKTIRFNLTLWYTAFLLFILVILVAGINVAIYSSRPSIPQSTSPYPGTSHDLVQAERERTMHDLLIFSIIGAGVVLVLGMVGGYFLSGFMLTPVDEVSSLASRISHTNLKERIKYEGPEDEVKRLADTFDNMLERLEGAFESQKQFIQDASHELRTPIAIAQTNIEVLEMEKRATREDYKKLLDILKMSLQRMNDINNSLLLLSEDTPSETRLSRLNVNSLLDEVYRETGAEATSAGIKLEWQPSESGVLEVRGDVVHLKQAVINLVDNAIKYNRPGGNVRLSANVENDSIAIEVADTGIGISAEDLPHVFDRFYRVDRSRSRERGGSGLGLAIVKKIIEDHGGTISVESLPDQGSTFHIAIPRLT